jgi:hypothetical protein
MDETVRLTYTELAKARGITLPAARRLALRHKWRKQLGNDGLTHVWVPVAALPRDGTSDPIPDLRPDSAPDIPVAFALNDALIATIAAVTHGAVSDALSGLRSELRSDLQSDMRSVIPALQEAITTLRVELNTERDRAERAERRVQELEAQLVARRSWWPRRR